jgi:hypothetical protein
MKNYERVIFTPGLGIRSNTMEYHEIDNIAIAGLCGSGKDTLLNSILVDCILQNSSDKFTYVYIDTFSSGLSPFDNNQRISRYNEPMKLFRRDDYLNSVKEFLEYLCLLEDSKDYKGTLVVVINNYGSMPKYLSILVEYCLHKFDGSNTVKFLLAGQSSSEFNGILSLMRYRILTRTTEATSNDMLCCNIASNLSDMYGSCWFYDTKNRYVYTKHTVKFIHKGDINRLLKSLKCNTPTEKDIVKHLNDIRVNLNYDISMNTFKQKLYAIFGEDVIQKALTEFSDLVNSQMNKVQYKE